MQFISDPKQNNDHDKEANVTAIEHTAHDKDKEDSLEVKQRKAVRLYQMVWSGLTKYINSIIHTHSKAVEIPGFAIIGPLVQQW